MLTIGQKNNIIVKDRKNVVQLFDNYLSLFAIIVAILNIVNKQKGL